MNKDVTTKNTKSIKNKAYPKYKPSGVEWLGDVPEHWGVKRIGHTTYVKGRIGWQGLTSDEFIDEGPYCVTGTDFIDGKVNWKSCYHVAEERYLEDPYIKLKNNDLLITKDGTIGKTAIVKDLNDKATLNSGIFLTRPYKNFYRTDFLYWVLNSNSFDGFIELSKTGTTISHLYQNVFVRFKFPLPPLPEQQAIAAFLDRDTGRIDSLIAKKQRLLGLLAEQRTALISRAVTKGLDTTVKLKPSGVEWLGNVPEHWGVKRLKYQVTINDETLPETTDPDFELLYVDISSVNPSLGIVQKESLLFENAPSRARRIVRNGDTIVSTVRTYLRAISPVIDPESNLIVSTGFAVIRPRKVNQDYLSAAIRAPYFIEEVVSRSVGVSYPAINASEIGSISIPLPPLPEQQTIAAFLDRETAKIDTLSAKVVTVIERLKEYRTALISSAVTGKIDVSTAINTSVREAV